MQSIGPFVIAGTRREAPAGRPVAPPEPQPHPMDPPGGRNPRLSGPLLPSPDAATILPPMFESLLKSIFGSKHDRELKRVQPIVDEINRFCGEWEALSDEQLRGKTAEFRARLAEGKETL